MLPPSVSQRINAGRASCETQLLDFLRIPSVSTAQDRKDDVRRAAGWVLAQLTGMGFEAQIRETPGHPLVFARRCPRPDGPTVLIYGHFDVQPTDPDRAWITPPFEPQVRDGFVYARGACDDKGQLLTHLKALEAILAADGELPVNVKVLMEGEEEIGSPSLGPYVARHREELRADGVLISDGFQFARGIPAITCGLRGMAYLQVEVEGPRFDLHSGSFGGLVANPALVLAKMIARLTNADGTVAIPGFYDQVLPPGGTLRDALARLPFGEDALRSYTGVSTLAGESAYSLLERKMLRPTLDVNGIWGGFSGEGMKTIIPSRAGAKVSMRLVPDQNPDAISRLFTEYMSSLAPPGVRVNVTYLHGTPPVVIDTDHPWVRAAASAIEEGFGKAPVYIGEGGSIPVVTLFKRELGIDAILLLGWASPDDGAHSPNERMSIEDFQRGIMTSAALLYGLRSGT